MTRVKNKYSTIAVYKNKESYKNGNKPCIYLSRRDEEQGVDIQLDKQGYYIVAL